MSPLRTMWQDLNKAEVGRSLVWAKHENRKKNVTRFHNKDPRSVNFYPLDHNHTDIRGGEMDTNLLQIETRWIYTLWATKFPGLNENISFNSFKQNNSWVLCLVRCCFSPFFYLFVLILLFSSVAMLLRWTGLSGSLLGVMPPRLLGTGCAHSPYVPVARWGLNAFVTWH